MTTAPVAPPVARRHVHEADIVRILTFAGVIGVHTVSNTNAGSSVSANALVMLLHFTREAFFVLTGFVLAYQYLGRSMRVRSFWARRFLTVGIPYVAWSVLYAALEWWQGPRTMTLPDWLCQLGTYLIDGTAWYHLYFLLVSLQIYLLYPAIAALLRVTARHHWALLGVSAALQAVTLSMLNYFPPSGGIGGWYCRYAGTLIVTYQFYVLLGAVAAAHFESVLTWVRSHRAWVLGAFFATAGVTEAVYAVAVASGTRPSTAAAVLQPIVLPWAVAMTAALLVVGIFWSERRRPGSRADRSVQYASDRSFGIYLAHPAILWLLLWAGAGWLPGHFHGAALSVPVYLFTVIGAVTVVELMRRCPLSLSLTGRPALRTDRSGPLRGKESHRAHNITRTAVPRREAAFPRHDHGDRQRPADASLRRPDVELQRVD